jgi:hypothetical protein
VALYRSKNNKAPLKIGLLVALCKVPLKIGFLVAFCKAPLKIGFLAALCKAPQKMLSLQNAGNCYLIHIFISKCS